MIASLPKAYFQLFAGAALLLSALPVSGDENCVGLSAEEINQWRHKALFQGKTLYQGLYVDQDWVLSAVSRDSASTFSREIDYEINESTRFSWQWLIKVPIKGKIDERKKTDHDFAARISAVHKAGFAILDSNIINYIWSNQRPRGEYWASPYSENIVEVAVGNNVDGINQWHAYSRNIQEDFKKYW